MVHISNENIKKYFFVENQVSQTQQALTDQ